METRPSRVLPHSTGDGSGLGWVRTGVGQDWGGAGLGWGGTGHGAKQNTGCGGAGVSVATSEQEGSGLCGGLSGYLGFFQQPKHSSDLPVGLTA